MLLLRATGRRLLAFALIMPLAGACSSDGGSGTTDGPRSDTRTADAAKADQAAPPDRALADRATVDRAEQDRGAPDLPSAHDISKLPDQPVKPPLPDMPVKPPQPCKGACACPQGKKCINNTCTVVTPPEYCCSRSGCPAGAKCVWASGATGTCPSAGACKKTCDCYQGLVCINGACTKSPTGPTYCCDKPNCPPGSVCVDINGKANKCSSHLSCKDRCDCLQGDACVNGSCTPVTPKVYCCQKSGCPFGAACRYANGASSTCPSTGACKKNCDCNQALGCVNGKCTKAPGGAVYCCDRPWCPSGYACITSGGKKGTCP